MRLRVGTQVHYRIAQGKPVRLVSNGLGLCEEAHDNTQRLVHTVTLLKGINAQHVGVRPEGTWPDAEHRPPFGEVIQQNHAIRHNEGMVVVEANDASAQLEMLGTLRSRGYEDLR